MRNEFRTWPKADTLTAKKKLVRNVRHTVRCVNRAMKELHGDRFYAEIIQQQIKPYSDNSGWENFFRIAFHDNDHPKRDYSKWYNEHYIKYSGMFAGGDHFDTDFTNFILNAD